MARQLDWTILPSQAKNEAVVPSANHVYDLLNLTSNEAVVYGKRTWGINLVWTDPSKSDNIRFWRQSGSLAPIRYDELIAINVRNGKWLIYQKRDTGVNLGWSDSPRFEWKILGGTAGTEVMVATVVGLYSTVENDHLMYETRDWGINLKWYNDAGKFQRFSDIVEAGKTVNDWRKELGF